MDRLLCPKTSINEYFWTHHKDRQKLTNHEWAVTNEICSVLDLIANVTTKIQGSNGTHIGQATFFMKKLREIFKGELVEIRKADVEVSAIDYNGVSRDDLVLEV